MSDKPKVLIVATHPVQYQAPWFRHLHKNVHNYSFEVLYLCMPDAKQQGVGFGQAFEWDIPLLDGYNWNQLDDKFLSGSGQLDKFSSLRIKNPKRLLKQFNPAAVLLTGWQSLALVQLLYSCNHLNIPTLVRGDSNNLKPRKNLTKLLHKKLIKRYDKFLAVGRANSAFYLDNGTKQSDIYFCPHFVDNKWFSENAQMDAKQRTEIRQTWGIPKQAFCFSYVGKLNPKKRIMDVLQGFEKLSNEDSHLLIVGDGELRHQAETYVKQHDLNVSFAGFLNQSQITKAYVASDCLVLASDYDETWGLVVNEAMACGLAAIVSNRSGCQQDLIIEGETGYSFEFGDIDDLTSKMSIMLRTTETDAANTMGQKAKISVVNNYSIETATKGLICALDDSLDLN